MLAAAFARTGTNSLWPPLHAVEYTRKQKGEKRMKHYNGLVQLEVNRLADLYEVVRDHSGFT